MANYVIDTNVPIVANGDSQGVTIDCRIAAVELLQRAVDKGVIFLDSAGVIQAQYRSYLSPRGQPGVGDRFYLEVMNSDPSKVARVDVERNEDGQYADLTQEIATSAFDQADRVFVAVARKSNSPVYNAVDSDWVEHRGIIEDSGISIVFLCGADPASWREPTAS